MDKELRLMAERVLKRETNQFLQELENLMEKKGVEKVLKDGGSSHTDPKTHRTSYQRAPGTTQFKSLMDAASEAACIEELLLFISYQQSKKDGWNAYCENENNIARNLIDSFMSMQDNLYPEIKEEAEHCNISINDDDERILRLMISEKYMGYLFWRASIASKR